MPDVLTRYDIKKRELEHNAELAAKAFAQHVIELRHRSPCGKFASWRCHRSNSSAYYFDVSIEPGRISIFGDLGHCTWERTLDMIGWCRGSIDSIDYFAEKVPREIETKEFNKDMALAFIEEEKKQHLEDEEPLSEEIVDSLTEAAERGEHDFYQAYYDSDLYDGDLPGVKTFKNRFLWLRQAMKWFLEHVDQAAPEPAMSK